MDKKVVLYGASGHCKVIVDIIHSNNQVVEIIVDDVSNVENVFGIGVFRPNTCTNWKDKKIIISIGDNSIRKKISKTLDVLFHIAIHSKAIVSPFSTIGLGTVVMAGAIINPASSIGKHCIINSGAIIEHDCLIQDFVHISPNVSLAGNVSIQEGSHIGIGATVIQGITIGKWATIGAGAIIIDHVPDYAVVVGNPGKVIKFKENIENE